MREIEIEILMGFMFIIQITFGIRMVVEIYQVRKLNGQQYPLKARLSGKMRMSEHLAFNTRLPSAIILFLFFHCYRIVRQMYYGDHYNARTVEIFSGVSPSELGG